MKLEELASHGQPSFMRFLWKQTRRPEGASLKLTGCPSRALRGGRPRHQAGPAPRLGLSVRAALPPLTQFSESGLSCGRH